MSQFDSCSDMEYSGYAEVLTSMLNEDAEPAAIREYLEWAEKHMGLDPSPERITKVIAHLLRV